MNYFGARYLDPMLGLWTSVDPARQFSSPYLYAGNGYNSVNVVDPDGMEDIYLLRESGLLKNRQYINWPYNEWKERLKPSVEMMKNKGYSVFVGPVKDATVFAKLIKDPDAKRAFYVGHFRGNKEGKPDALSSYSNKAIVASVFGSYSNKSVELYLFGCNSKSLENSEWDSVFPKITGNTDNPIPLETMTEEFFNAVEKYATELPQKE